MAYARYITDIEIKALWAGRKHIRWHLNPDVNVLSGVNGVGKSTILRHIVSGVKSLTHRNNENVIIHTEPSDAQEFRFDIISTPDVRSEYDTNLSELLQRYATTEHDALRQKMLYDVIDDLFRDTEKTIVRSHRDTIVLQQYEEELDPKLLSNGEKQMLCILLVVYLQEGMPSVLFMDEPEVSLHIDWQQRLIATIRNLNPHVQIILTTHSPAIIMNGWMDKVTEVSDITIEE